MSIYPDNTQYQDPETKTHRVSVSSLPGSRETCRAIKQLSAPLWVAAAGVVIIGLLSLFTLVREEQRANQAEREVERAMQHYEDIMRQFGG